MSSHHRLDDSFEDPLVRLAHRAGLQTRWRDAWKRPQALSTGALRTVLNALDLPCRTAGECQASLARLVAEDATQPLPPLITADQGSPVAVPWTHTLSQRPYRLECEDGTIVEGIAHRTGEGTMEIAPIDQWGYHRLLLGDIETTIAVAPRRCFGIADALADSLRPMPTRRPWGLAVQLYSLRRSAATGMGDLTALAHCAEAAAQAGADAIAINPLHAGFAGLAERYSPYAPSSRLFFNALYADPACVFGQHAVEQAVTALRLGNALSTAEASPVIDWPTLAPMRYAVLRWLWEHRDALLTLQQQQAFAAFGARGGKALFAHACFEAIQAEPLATGLRAEAADWRNWPLTLRTPDDPAVAAFATSHADAVGYHEFLQWLTAEGLAVAQRRARAAGMAIGVIADLAVGTDPAGSHAWMRQQEILGGFHAGAPPDLYNPRGQDWGVAVFSPRGLRRSGYAAFIEMLRANLAHAGGLRIDHVLGLARMWIVPAGAAATAGAYLTYPMDDLLRLVAIESWRHRAIIIGENLGTVPEAFNAALSARGVYGIDVLWFEREPDACDTSDTPNMAPAAAAPFLPPDQWPRDAVATTSTHDLPTIAGWWRGTDIAWRARLRLLGTNETEAGLIAERATERSSLWQAMCRHGVAAGEEPPVDRAPVEAILRWLSRVSTPLRLVPAEDLLALREQPNIPGTVTGHPNWRRRLDVDVLAMFRRDDVLARVAALRSEED